MKEPIFDYNGGMYGILLAALPLKEGFKAKFPSLSEDHDEIDWIGVVMGKQELVEAGPGKQVMAWPIDTEGNYANKSHSIFWITKRGSLRHQTGDHNSHGQVGDSYDQHDLNLRPWAFSKSRRVHSPVSLRLNSM